MKLSSLHETAVDFSRDVSFATHMADSREKIVGRLLILPTVLTKSKGELALAAGVTPSQWSNYISLTSDDPQIIPWHAAVELKIFEITMDYIYAGDLLSIRNTDLRLRLQQAERELGPVKLKPRPRRKRRRQYAQKVN